MYDRGFPVWLRDVPGIVFRTDNEPYKVDFLLFVNLLNSRTEAEKVSAIYCTSLNDMQCREKHLFHASISCYDYCSRKCPFLDTHH